METNSHYKQFPSDKDNINENKSFLSTSLFSWGVQITILTTSLFFIITLLTDYLNLSSYLLLFIWIVSYILYIIMAFNLQIYNYLLNSHSIPSFHNYIEMLLSQPAEIQFNAECYHMETKTNENQFFLLHKVISHQHSYSFNYYSCKDLSGLPYLQSLLLNKQAFIVLDIELEIYFFDPLSYSDYLNQKQHFYLDNFKLDTCSEFSVGKSIKDISIKDNLITVTNGDYDFVNIYCFYFFTFLFPIIMLYSLYVESLCSLKKCKITKVISTRFDLNDLKYLNELFEKRNMIPLIEYNSFVSLNRKATSLNLDEDKDNELVVQSERSTIEPNRQSIEDMMKINFEDSDLLKIDAASYHLSDKNLIASLKKRESFNFHYSIKPSTTFEGNKKQQI